MAFRVLSRERISKTTKEAVFQKLDGKCGYCGLLLSKKKWVIDHIVPYKKHFKEGLPEDPNRISNLMACCQECNIKKRDFTVEQFRSALSEEHNKMRKFNGTFRYLERFGFVKSYKSDVVFHFEKIDFSVT